MGKIFHNLFYTSFGGVAYARYNEHIEKWDGMKNGMEKNVAIVENMIKKKYKNKNSMLN